ncbi:MAG: NifB/NifX family molybdenum-iron cluster-binding protein [Victivallaceae bacterium]|nr:NifB/NifX family molybdenum-iron cluster-binding protein [Victivallaceae bacterium]
MKIAVASEDRRVFQHFGHTPEFSVFDIEDERICGMQVVPTGESGHGALAGLLTGLGVSTLLCGGIGGGAIEALGKAGITVVGGVSGDVVEAVGDYLMNRLDVDPDFRCAHHHDGDSHTCGEHGCGDHSCGAH